MCEVETVYNASITILQFVHPEPGEKINVKFDIQMEIELSFFSFKHGKDPDFLNTLKMKIFLIYGFSIIFTNKSRNNREMSGPVDEVN